MSDNKGKHCNIPRISIEVSFGYFFNSFNPCTYNSKYLKYDSVKKSTGMASQHKTSKKPVIAMSDFDLQEKCLCRGVILQAYSTHESVFF